MHGGKSVRTWYQFGNSIVILALVLVNQSRCSRCQHSQLQSAHYTIQVPLVANRLPKVVHVGQRPQGGNRLRELAMPAVKVDYLREAWSQASLPYSTAWAQLHGANPRRLASK